MARIDECQNFLAAGRCQSWIIENFKSGEYSGEKDQTEKEQIEKADKVCSDCPNFKKKDSPESHSATHQLFRKGKLITSNDPH
jgi:hypothetical protein